MAQKVVLLADTLRAGAVMDTLDTDDRYTKLVLYSDKTWRLVDLRHPSFDDEDFDIPVEEDDEEDFVEYEDWDEEEMAEGEDGYDDEEGQPE